MRRQEISWEDTDYLHSSRWFFLKVCGMHLCHTWWTLDDRKCIGSPGNLFLCFIVLWHFFLISLMSQLNLLCYINLLLLFVYTETICNLMVVLTANSLSINSYSVVDCLLYLSIIPPLFSLPCLTSPSLP